MKITYDITCFDYDKESRTFTAVDSELFTPDHSYYFPNRRGQFFIENSRTKGFRRFRLLNETQEFYRFSSKDDFICVIKKSGDESIVKTIKTEKWNKIQQVLQMLS